MKIRVTAYSRLHLGLYELGAHFGRRFGGLGVYVEEPRIIVEAQPHEYLVVSGDRKQDTLETVQIIRKSFGRKARLLIKVSAQTPLHRGFGSVTQHKLAVAMAVLNTWNIDHDIYQLAKILGRGTISNIGTILFHQGGFVVEFPKKDTTQRPSFIRISFPETWSFVVAYPLHESGPDDTTESILVRQLKPMEQYECMQLSHIVFSILVPSLLEHNFDEFAEALSNFQKLVGRYFSHVQGGVFRSAKAVEALEKSGAVGVGQSSWGPAVYGLCQTMDKAVEVARAVRQLLGPDWVVFSAKAVNHGAEISVTP
ncbi:MAG: hypothetical protein QW463_06875 [Candidatus Caldarchaeum sp.]